MVAQALAPSRASSATGRELQIAGSWPRRVGLIALIAGTVVIPLSISSSLWLTVLAYSGIATIAVTGLNMLLGYAGELSIGHAFFVAVGAYTAVWVGDTHHQSLIVWMVSAAVAGAAVGGLIAPLAVRIRGPYLIVVTLGLVVAGNYLFSNWTSLTGGAGGRTTALPLALGPVNFGALTLGSTVYNRNQSLCVLIWLVAALSIFLVRNIVRSRAGRSMQAARDNDLAAELAGVSLSRVKTSAFMVSGAVGAVAGALFVAELQFVLPSAFDVNLSVQYLSMLIVGGTATTFGPVIGAIVISALPQLVQQYGSNLPFIKPPGTSSGFGVTVAQFSVISYGGLLVLFLLLEPNGLAALANRGARGIGRILPHSEPAPTSRVT
jgi:branched-chain amino acid transport system permease protein